MKSIQRNKRAGRDRDVLCIIRATRRSIGGILGAGDWDKDEIIIGKEFSPACLAAIEGFGGYEDLQIFVI